MSNPGGQGWPNQPQQPYEQGFPQAYDQQYQQPFGQTQQYQLESPQGFGGYPPPEPPKKKTGLWIAAVALVIVIAVGITLLFVLTSKDEQQAAPPPPTSAPAPSSPSASGVPEDNKTESTTPGWQGLKSIKDGAAYDIPSGFDTKPGRTAGYDDGPTKVVMHESMVYKAGACPESRGSNRGRLGFVTVDQMAPEEAAMKAAKAWAIAGSTEKDTQPPQIADPPVSQLPIAGGTIQASSATVTFTSPESEECRAPNVLVVSAAFKNGDKTTCFLITVDQGTPDSLPAEDAKKIVASLRPLK
ncbi:hypothetical protein SAMN05421504_11672 [Amycolatopsis xylanica]|uniref:DUF8017 domain-containing protein n=1 Tax=Amycolatopsis xylanica TaxID=589385 RepID=A0A1H3SYK6_9PSEU|nr:hypothetical protein [Amycolatopsis xylanica]SDZ43014.1 hypothetical protein SAMN05421504_11672 [Amycolatopsis xylanica]